MQTIIVDMTPGFRMPTIYYSQGDVGTQFAIDLRSRFGDSFPTGTTVTIQATKPSGFGFSVAATSVTNGVATFTTTAEMTDEFGRFPAELKVTKTGLTLFSANFYMDGEENTHPDGTIDGQQETVIPELAQLVERVEDAASSVLDMTVVANTLPAGSDATYSYDEETNTATFGIPKGADGSLASGVLAPTYSSSSTYAVGDYVYYSGSLYRCTTAITTAEAWTSGHWTQVALAPEVSDLKSALRVAGVVGGNVAYTNEDTGYPHYILTGIELVAGRTYKAVFKSSALINTPFDVGFASYGAHRITAQQLADGFEITIRANATTSSGSVYYTAVNWVDVSANISCVIQDITANETIEGLSLTTDIINKTLFNTIPLKRNESGETIIASFPVEAGKAYRIFAKSSINVGASVAIGLGYNGNIQVSASDLVNGYTWNKVATTSNESSRVYITQSSGSYDGTIFASITDITDETPTFTELGHLSEPSSVLWYDGAINYETGEIDSLGRYMHSNMVEVDCNAEIVNDAVGLRFYDAVGKLIGYQSGAVKQLISEESHKYIKFVITGQDPSKFRIYSKDDVTPFEGYNNAVAVMRKAGDGTISSSFNMNQFFTAVHITDVHGDRVRFGRAVDFAKKIGADAIINTGDSVRYYGTDDFTFVTSIVSNSDIPYYQVVGNHELQSITSESVVYDKYISPFVTKNGYVLGGTGKPYYHVDIADKKIRLIVVDQYEKYDGTMNIQLSASQLNWFCQTLASTPANYGVIVCHHIPEVGISKDNEHAVFYQEPYWDESTTACLSKIVDTFISGTTFSDTLYGNAISADFTSKATGAHFVSFINGHQHQDRIGVVQGTANRQLVLNSICSNAWFNMNQNGTLGTSYPYYNELNDIGRVDRTPTQDAFNVYTFDLTNKVVRVARIGSSITTNMNERKRMIIPYA